MERRDFLRITPLTLAGTTMHADTAMPTVTLGKSGLRVSRFCLGGYHMRVKGEEYAIKLIQRAVDLGVTFFDSAALYHNGGSDETYGKALQGRRDKVVLMSKAHLYSYDEAMGQLEKTLRSMKTDHLDLWQCHQVSTQAEVDQILGPKGSLEAFVKAKKEGKVRHIGFTGHRDPNVHQRLLASFDGWETVQMPINLIDPHYLSFRENVLPKARAKGLGVIAMKSNAMGQITAQSVAKIEDCLRFTLSQDIDVLVSGVETIEQLEQNVGLVKAFSKMKPAEVSELLQRTKQGPVGSKVERYKLKEDGTAAVHVDGSRA